MKERRRESVLQRPLLLADLLDLPTFQDVVKGFAELYKVGIKVFDERGDKLADVKVGNGDFCGYVFSFSEGRGRCTSTVGRIKDGALSLSQGARPAVSPELTKVGAVAMPCFTGLRYLLMPILWEGAPLGRIIFGPFTPEEYGEFPPTLMDIPGLDPATLSEHLAKIRRAPESTVGRVMLHFAQVLQTLIAAGQKAYLTSQLHIEATLETNRELELKNQKLEELNARLTELDRLKSSFLATVSHELRTPLTSIIGYSEMLTEGLAGPLNGEQADYVRTILEKGETLLKLISSILDISQIEAGKVRLNFQRVELAEVIESAVASLRAQAGRKGVSVVAQLATRFRRASVDPDKLRQVVVNLLSNAVKFTPPGGRVLVSLSEKDWQPEIGAEGYQIRVQDSGVGIPPDQFAKIFQTFYQVDSSSTREFGGAGLGLAIVKSFVEGHGGVVRVTSELGQGSSLIAILPLEPGHSRAHPAPSSSAAAEPDRF